MTGVDAHGVMEREVGRMPDVAGPTWLVFGRASEESRCCRSWCGEAQGRRSWCGEAQGRRSWCGEAQGRRSWCGEAQGRRSWCGEAQGRRSWCGEARACWQGGRGGAYGAGSAEGAADGVVTDPGGHAPGGTGDERGMVL